MLPAVFPAIVAPWAAVALSDTGIVIISVDAVAKPVVAWARTAIAVLANVTVMTLAFVAISFNCAIVGLSDISTKADVATTRVLAVTNAAVTCAVLPAILIAFVTVTVALVLPPAVDKSVAATVTSFDTLSYAASFIVIVITSVAAVVKPAIFDAESPTVAVTLPVTAAILFTWETLGVPDIVGFAVAAITFVATVTTAATTSDGEPVITIAFSTVATSAVFPPMLDSTVASILVSFTSFIDIVITSVDFVVKVSTVAAAAAAIVAVVTPAFAEIAFKSAIAGVSDIVTNALVATTNVATVTNAAVTSSSVPDILIALFTVTAPVVLFPIVDNTVAATVTSFVSELYAASLIFSCTSLSLPATVVKLPYVLAE